MAEFEIKINNIDKVLGALDGQVAKALEECGLVAEGYAKVNITQQRAVDTGVLRNSITHVLSSDSVTIGSNVKYAPYIELGTGEYYPSGRKTPWVFQDSKGNWHKTTGQKARPYLKPAISDHVATYKGIIEKELSN